jgi:competence transcription factor ComK
MEKKKNYTVRICEDHVIRDPDKVKEILDRVSKIISNSYIGERKKNGC